MGVKLGDVMTSPAVIDFLAGHEHFRDHTLPVWRALPPEMRGGFFTHTALDPGLKGEPRSERAGRGDLILVCSHGDMLDAQYADMNRPIIFMEHGAGMSFASLDGSVTYSSYSGSRDRANVALFLNVNEYARANNEAAHPFTAQAVIGSPKMDRWYPAPAPARKAKPLVGVSWHWDCLLSPGTRSAFPHYKNALQAFLSDDWDIVMTAHPRYRPEVSMACTMAGIPYVNSLDPIFEDADMLIGDATSAMFEFASLDRPVLTLNAPWYHLMPDEGVRFWKEIPGIQVESPDELQWGIRQSLKDPPKLQAQRRAAVDNVYPIRGNAAATAVSAIKEFVKTCR